MKIKYILYPVAERGDEDGDEEDLDDIKDMIGAHLGLTPTGGRYAATHPPPSFSGNNSAVIFFCSRGSTCVYIHLLQNN